MKAGTLDRHEFEHMVRPLSLDREGDWEGDRTRDREGDRERVREGDREGDGE